MKYLQPHELEKLFRCQMWVAGENKVHHDPVSLFRNRTSGELFAVCAADENAVQVKLIPVTESDIILSAGGLPPTGGHDGE